MDSFDAFVHERRYTTRNEILKAYYESLSKLNERSWVAVADGLPKIGVPVWMRFESGLIVIGEMGMVSDDEWLWGQAYGGARYVKGRWEVDDSDTDDDYRPTHWMPLPEPPK